MTSFLFPITNFTSVAGDEKRDVVCTYSKARGHKDELILSEKIPIEKDDDSMDVGESTSLTTPAGPESSSEEQDKINSLMRQEELDEQDKINSLMRQEKLEYFTSIVKDLHVKESDNMEVIESKENFSVEVVPFQAIILRDPVTGTIAQILPFPYSRTKMTKIFSNDIQESVRKYFGMFSQLPKVVASNNIFQVWEVPFEYDPVITYKMETIYASEILEARAIASFYGVVPSTFQGGETEIWIVPSSLPSPSKNKTK
jgi:hypothetical protein